MTRPHLPPIHEWTYSATAPFQGRYALSLAHAGFNPPRPYAGVALEYSGPLGGRDALWEVYVYGTLPSDPVTPHETRPRPVLAHGPALGLREAIERAERQIALDFAQAPAAPVRRPGKAPAAPRKAPPARRAPPARAAAKATPKRPAAPSRGRAAASKANAFSPLAPPLDVACGKAPRRR